jgi:indolepyruvate ferredoxin oxidoreductase, beta subunit
MKTDIIIAGVGGQGILSIAACAGLAAIKSKLHLKQAEVHGMSQRGGAVQSHLRLSDREVSSDLIPLGQADLIISVEPMESLRYLPWLSSDGWLVTNTTPVRNIEGYPDIEEIIAEIERVNNHVIIDADTIAREIGTSRVSNMVMLGAASFFINIELEKFESAIAAIFGRKGEETVRMNIQALNAGRDFSGKRKY